MARTRREPPRERREARGNIFLPDEALLEPLKLKLRPSIVTIQPPIDKGFDKRLREDPELTRLLGNPPKLSGRATERTDGRRVPLVLALVRDRAGASRPGLLVQLRAGRLLDESRTDARGAVVLRFPRRRRQAEEVTGTVRVLLPGGSRLDEDVTVPAGRQHALVELELPDLLVDEDRGGSAEAGAAPSDAPTAAAGAAGGGHAGDAAARTFALAPLQLGDNPLDRLPADFDTSLCVDLKAILGPPQDPILGGIGGTGGPTDFRSRRLPLIKRLTIPRIGLVPAGGQAPPRRYLVRVRQEWTFLGYTLGELAGVEALDPGQVIEETRRELERTVARTSREVDQRVSEALATISSSLNQLSSIDTLITNATSSGGVLGASGFGTIAGAAVGGGIGALIGGPIGALIGGGLGALLGGGGADPIGAATSAVNRTTTNTSLLVNSFLRQSQSQVNQAIRTLTSTARTLEASVGRTVDQVSPLLSRVTNLLRWLLYENYIVCTEIEDIVEVIDVRITALGDPDDPLFSDEDIVEYRRFFSPRLLEPSLRPRFAALERAVQQKRGAAMPIAAVAVDVDYAANLFGADLRIIIDPAGAVEETIPLTLTPRGSRAGGRVRFTVPVPAGEIGQARLELSLRSDIVDLEQLNLFNLAEALRRAGVGVTRVRFRFESTPEFVHEQSEHLGSELRVSTEQLADAHTVPLEPPQPAIFTQFDPLFLHVNRNRAYYFGLLAQAALGEPGLRDNAPQLQSFPYTHPLWRLPVVGFEGDRVLVIQEVDEDTNDPDVAPFFADEGAASIIQLAAPGAYAEALQGLLQLADAAGRLHPSLLPLPAPVMPPLALVDLAGRQLQVVPTDSVPSVPGTPLPGGGTPVPPPGGGGTPLPVPVPPVPTPPGP